MKNAKMSKFSYMIIGGLLIIVAILSYYFVSNDEAYYNRPIAKITSIHELKKYEGGSSKDGEILYNQRIKAVMMNGKFKGRMLELSNAASYSRVLDIRYRVSDEVFVELYGDINRNTLSGRILDFKRDKYIAYISIAFVLLILLVGGIKGFRSLASVMVNVMILGAVIKLYLSGVNPLIIVIMASLFFIVFSIFIVNGINKKSGSAIVGTIVGTVIAMLITILVMLLTGSKGMHYEEMEFLSHPPKQIFLMEVLIGTLGGIMDIAITISSSIKEMYDNNPSIDRITLIKSSMEIGKDIMGTMANTLIFAYISGSIPMILLWLKNGYMIFYIININLSLEIIRALTGSIGIVVSIPITLYISVILLKSNKKWGI